MIKRIIYLMFAAGIMLSACKNNGNVAQTASGGEETETVTTASAETAQSVSLATDSLVKPKGILPYPEDGLSGDAIEHEVSGNWQKISIYAKQTGNDLSIMDVFTAIVEVYPAPQLLEAWYALDDNTAHTSKGRFVYDENSEFISGEWPDAGEFANNFALKAWKLMADGQWVIGLVYKRLWDGDDGIGVYQNLMFWTYDISDQILRPVDTEDRFLPDYTPERGYVVFHKENDNLDFEEGADPDLFWKWNGYWFESSASRE